MDIKKINKKTTIIVLITLFLLTILWLFNNYIHKNQYQGYIEGQYRYIAPQYTGRLKQLNVQRGSFIKAGQALFTLELQPELDQLNQAKANMLDAQTAVIQAKANLDLAKLTLTRSQILVKKGATQQETLDNARTTYAVDQARLEQAIAQLTKAQSALTQAQWTQQQKIITADVSGLIFDTYYLPGELVPNTHPVLAMLAPQDIKVIFYIPETRVASIALQQKISLQCDGCKKNIYANITFISPRAEYTPPVIYSNETRSKLVYRIEAFVPNALRYHLYPGLPVTVKTIENVMQAEGWHPGKE